MDVLTNEYMFDLGTAGILSLRLEKHTIAHRTGPPFSRKSNDLLLHGLFLENGQKVMKTCVEKA